MRLVWRWGEGQLDGQTGPNPFGWGRVGVSGEGLV